MKVSKMKAGILLLVCMCILLGTGGAVSSAPPSVSAELTVVAKVPVMLLIALDPDEITFTETDILEADPLAGDETVLAVYKIAPDDTGIVNIWTIGNIPYDLHVGVETEELAGPSGGIDFKRLAWRRSGEHAAEDQGWTNLDPEHDVRVISGEAQEEKNTGLDFRLVVEVTQLPGDYTGVLVFTLSAESSD